MVYLFTFISYSKAHNIHIFLPHTQNGFVILANSRETRISNFDSRWILGMPNVDILYKKCGPCIHLILYIFLLCTEPYCTSTSGILFLRPVLLHSMAFGACLPFQRVSLLHFQKEFDPSAKYMSYSTSHFKLFTFSLSIFPRIASSVKALLPTSIRESFVLHNGSDEMVLESLAQYSLPKHCIPEDLGEWE